MKFYSLAMLLLMFNVSLALINYLDLMTYQEITPQQDFLDTVNSKDFLNQSYASTAAEDSSVTDYGNFRKGLSIFVKTLFYATVGFPFMFMEFGLNPVLAWLLAVPIYAVYIFGLVQFFSKQPFEGIR